jgi:hypothetical protein
VDGGRFCDLDKKNRLIEPIPISRFRRRSERPTKPTLVGRKGGEQMKKLSGFVINYSKTLATYFKYFLQAQYTPHFQIVTKACPPRSTRHPPAPEAPGSS